jgi:hypothetical protein
MSRSTATPLICNHYPPLLLCRGGGRPLEFNGSVKLEVREERLTSEAEGAAAQGPEAQAGDGGCGRVAGGSEWTPGGQRVQRPLRGAHVPPAGGQHRGDGDLLDVRLREGNVHSANGALEFIEELLTCSGPPPPSTPPPPRRGASSPVSVSTAGPLVGHTRPRLPRATLAGEARCAGQRILGSAGLAAPVEVADGALWAGSGVRGAARLQALHPQLVRPP